MDELIKANVNEPVIKEDDSFVYRGKLLSVDKTTPNIDFKGLLNTLFQCADMVDTIKHIKKGKEYLVVIPDEFQHLVDIGEYFMMEGKDKDKLWPSLMRIGEDGRRKIVSPLPIKEREFIEGNPFSEITENYHNLYLQGQLNELNNKLESTLETVKSIKQGQKDDRVGALNSGRTQILLALNQKDESSRINAYQLGVSHLCLAQGQFEESLKTMVREFEPIPKSRALQFAKTVKDSNYREKKDDEYEDIEDYFDLYMQSTQMIAATYAIMGDLDNAELVYNTSIDRVKSIDFSNVKSIEYIHRNEDVDWVYNNAVSYLNFEKRQCLQDGQHYDGIEIRISGDELLEAISNGREEGREEVQES